MKYVLIWILKLIMVICYLAWTPCKYVFVILFWLWDFESHKALLEDDDFAVQYKPVNLGCKYYVYKTAFDYLLDRKTYKIRME